MFTTIYELVSEIWAVPGLAFISKSGAAGATCGLGPFVKPDGPPLSTARRAARLQACNLVTKSQ
eukprot:335983-Hanusia_phi.AAC.1